MVPDNTSKLHVRVRNIVAANAAAQQNLFFGDDINLKIHTSRVHNDEYFAFGFTPTGTPIANAFLKAGQEYSYTVTRPASGIWRITPTGDWTNAGNVSFDVDVWTEQESLGSKTASASIGNLETHTYDIVVPAGTASLNVRADWSNMSGSYPVNDVDVTLVSPANVNNFACSTGRTPELCSVANPAAGTWKVRVEGFSVSAFGTPSGKEKYTLHINADGTVLKPVE